MSFSGNLKLLDVFLKLHTYDTYGIIPQGTVILYPGAYYDREGPLIFLGGGEGRAQDSLFYVDFAFKSPSSKSRRTICVGKKRTPKTARQHRLCWEQGLGKRVVDGAANLNYSRIGLAERGPKSFVQRLTTNHPKLRNIILENESGTFASSSFQASSTSLSA